MEGAHNCKPSNYLINSVLHFNILILLPRLQHFLTQNPLLTPPRKSARKHHTPSAFHKAPISSMVLNISWQTEALPRQSCLIDFALRELVRMQAAPQLTCPPLQASRQQRFLAAAFTWITGQLQHHFVLVTSTLPPAGRALRWLYLPLATALAESHLSDSQLISLFLSFPKVGANGARFQLYFSSSN